MPIDCEKTRKFIHRTKEDKDGFDERCRGTSEKWDFVDLRLWKTSLEKRLESLRSEVEAIKGYRFAIEAIDMRLNPGDIEKSLDFKYRNRDGASIKITVIKIGLVLDMMNDIDSKIPNNLEVKEYLNFKGTKITKLPRGLVVGGNLHINRTKIKKLPDDLIVHGDIYIDPILTDEVTRINGIYGSVHVGLED